jgi:hypothetical protein
VTVSVILNGSAGRIKSGAAAGPGGWNTGAGTPVTVGFIVDAYRQCREVERWTI